jgi:Zn-finger nucleic acid-binding protein
MDSTDVVTKMYVRPQDDTSVVSGKINIDTCPANKSKEDYLLNFDYLYANKLINKEQYDEIAEYEKKMRQFNTTLDDLSLRLAAYEDELIT